MKKQKQPTPPPHRTIKGTKKENSLIPSVPIEDLEPFEEQNKKREQKRIDTEIRIVQIAGGIIGIIAFIWAGFAYGIELPIILFMAIISNNLCNVK